MNKSKVYKKIKLELIKEKKYFEILKYHNSLNALKYFSAVLLAYILMFIINEYVISFIDGSFNIIYLSISILVLTILCRFGYFENKLINKLAVKNNCITLEDFYNLVLSKQEKIESDLWFITWIQKNNQLVQVETTKCIAQFVIMHLKIRVQWYIWATTWHQEKQS